MNLARLFSANRTPRYLRSLTRPHAHRMMTAAVWHTPHDGWAAEHYERVAGDVAYYLRRVGGFPSRQAAEDFVNSSGARLPRAFRYWAGHTPTPDLVLSLA